MSAELAAAYQAHRAALRAYLTSLVVRPDVAEELLQETALRALEHDAAPTAEAALKPWFFRVATNLAIDHLRRERAWGLRTLEAARGRAETDPDFLAESRRLVGSPETRAIAREHLAVCFVCTVRALPTEQSAALLLKEVGGLSVDELAQVMSASFGQAKNWLQTARATLRARYRETCALVNKQGACFQCVELDRFFQADQGDPLAGTTRSLDARLTLLREASAKGLGPWHQQMMKLVAEVVAADEPPKA